jgi:hypothetical protein
MIESAIPPHDMGMLLQRIKNTGEDPDGVIARYQGQQKCPGELKLDSLPQDIRLAVRDRSNRDD